MYRETPSATMYADLKQFGRISNLDAAKLLLDGCASFGGLSLRDRVDERTFLSREIVHAEPGSLPETLFADFGQSAQEITSRLLARRKGADAPAAVAGHYGGEAARLMRAALKGCGLDDTLYGNAVESIARLGLPRESDRCALLVLLFVATGCLGDPKRAVAHVEAFAANMLQATFRTVEAQAGPGAFDDSEDAMDTVDENGVLGLARIENGRLCARIHALSPDGEGTVIGSLSTADNAVTDVGPGVSRKHLRIWRDQGRWFAEGMGSTNGSSLISGDDKRERVIEPPRSERRGFASAPVEVLPGDVLCLGASTRFMVLELAPSD